MAHLKSCRDSLVPLLQGLPQVRVAPAQGGLHPSGRRTYGHSMVVDPWGEVLAVRPEGEGVVLAEIDTDRIREVRRSLPALLNRRLI